MHVALRPRYIVALLLPILVSAAPVRAADAPPGLPGVRAAVDVTAMDLDVVATTRDGRPVSDLTRAEISVTVNGQPFPLDYFVKVEAGQLHGPDLTLRQACGVLGLERDRASARPDVRAGSRDELPFSV